MSANNRYITSAESLVTTHEETRAGFLSIALEKNRVGDPFVKNALAFKAMVAHTHCAEDLLTIPQVRPFLITAAGLSDKSLAYLNEDDQTMAIQELIDKFLKPAGADYIDENNNEERKCKICGKIIVGKNKAGICSACKKKAGDTGVTVMGVLALIGGAIWTGVKAFTKKD